MWPTRLKSQCLGEHTVVADCKPLQIPQALATTQNSQHRHQQQLPDWDAYPYPAPHPRIRDRLQLADQVKIDCGRSAFSHKKGAIPPISAHADSHSKGDCDGL